MRHPIQLAFTLAAPAALALACETIPSAPEAIALEETLADDSAHTCSATSLGALNGWAAVALESFRLSNNDVGGRVASLGDITLVGASVGEPLPEDPTRVDILAGRDLSLAASSAPKGRVVAAGRARVTDGSALGGVKRADDPVLARMGDDAHRLSHEWAALPTNGSAVVTPIAGGRMTLTLTGKSATLNVFQARASDLTAAATLDIVTPAGSTTLINIVGGSVTLRSFEIRLPERATATPTIVHFVDAHDIHVTSSTIGATVLAPEAVIIHSNSQWRGNVIARVIAGDSRFDYRRFSGCVSGSP